MLRFPAPLAVLLLATACAPAAQGVPERRTERSLAMIRAGEEIRLTHDASITSAVVAAAPAEVWQAMPQIYAALELPLTGKNDGARVVESVQRVRRVAGRSMSSYFECPGPYGNLASSGDVFLTVRSQVLAEGEGAQVRHEVQAVARSSTSSTNSVQCSSKGALEKLLEETVAKRFAAR